MSQRFLTPKLKACSTETDFELEKENNFRQIFESYFPFKVNYISLRFI